MQTRRNVGAQQFSATLAPMRSIADQQLKPPRHPSRPHCLQVAWTSQGKVIDIAKVSEKSYFVANRSLVGMEGRGPGYMRPIQQVRRNTKDFGAR